MKKTVIFIILAVTIMSAAFGQGKRYGIERAIVKKTTVQKLPTMSMEQTVVQYFVDYGSKESAESTMSMQGQTFNVITMIKDGYIYSANINLKQGAKINLADMDDYSQVNFLDLTDEVKKKYQIQANGVEQVLGKPCNRYEMSFTAQGQNVTATIWVWQGIELKSKVNAAGTTTESEATEIQEGAAIANEKFELPEGINFMEVKP